MIVVCVAVKPAGVGWNHTITDSGIDSDIIHRQFPFCSRRCQFLVMVLPIVVLQSGIHRGEADIADRTHCICGVNLRQIPVLECEKEDKK